MKIKYLTKNIYLSGELHDILEKKLEKFSHLSPSLKEINVDLTYGAGHAKNNSIRLEIQLYLIKPEQILRAVTMASNIIEAMDILEPKLKKQLETIKKTKEIKRKISRRLIRAQKSL